jgi:hypothetical protein
MCKMRDLNRKVKLHITIKKLLKSQNFESQSYQILTTFNEFLVSHLLIIYLTVSWEPI